MDDFMEPTQGEVPADDSFGMPAGDMGGMDLGGAPPLADAGGFGDADFGVMGGAPPLADADDMGGLGDFGGAPPLEVGGGLDLGGEDAFGIGGGAPPLGGSADDFGMAGLSVGEEPPQFAPMGGMDMGDMGMGGMDMGGMAEPPSAEEPLPVFGQAAPPSAMPDFSAPTVRAFAAWRASRARSLAPASIPVPPPCRLARSCIDPLRRSFAAAATPPVDDGASDALCATNMNSDVSHTRWKV